MITAAAIAAWQFTVSAMSRLNKNEMRQHAVRTKETKRCVDLLTELAFSSEFYNRLKNSTENTFWSIWFEQIFTHSQSFTSKYSI